MQVMLHNQYYTGIEQYFLSSLVLIITTHSNEDSVRSTISQNYVEVVEKENQNEESYHDYDLLQKTTRFGPVRILRKFPLYVERRNDMNHSPFTFVKSLHTTCLEGVELLIQK